MGVLNAYGRLQIVEKHLWRTGSKWANLDGREQVGMQRNILQRGNRALCGPASQTPVRAALEKGESANVISFALGQPVIGLWHILFPLLDQVNLHIRPPEVFVLRGFLPTCCMLAPVGFLPANSPLDGINQVRPQLVRRDNAIKCTDRERPLYAVHAIKLSRHL